MPSSPLWRPWPSMPGNPTPWFCSAWGWRCSWSSSWGCEPGGSAVLGPSSALRSTWPSPSWRAPRSARRCCSPGCSSPPGASGRRRRARRHCLFTTSGPWCSRDSTGSRWRAAAGSVASSGDTSYLEAATYVGVIAVVLAVLAVALRHRHPEVLAMSAVAVVMGAIAFFSPVVGVLDMVPYGIRWHRGAIVLALALAVLAGVGTDVLIRSHRERAVRRWAGGGFACVALFLGMLWLFGRGSLPPTWTRRSGDRASCGPPGRRSSAWPWWACWHSRTSAGPPVQGRTPAGTVV